MSYRNRELQEHFQRLVGLGCLVSGRHPEIHHCKAGSMQELIGMHGMSMKVDDWLTIPLSHEYHQGRFGIERGVRTWEKKFGTQIKLLIVVVDRLGVDVFAKAGVAMSLDEIRRNYGAP